MLTDRAKEIVAAADEKMQDAANFFEEDLKNYRVGKANPSIFNNVTVDYYGTPTPIPQVSSVTTPDARTLVIQPWERNMLAKIEKAIIDTIESGIMTGDLYLISKLENKKKVNTTEFLEAVNETLKKSI
jgi:ribosome recycling factor